MTIVVTGLVVLAIAGERSWALPLTGLVLLLALTLLLGISDGRGGFPVARGERAAFAVLAVLSAGTVLVPYLPAYFGARQLAPTRDRR
ncbi:MAG: hypothetical protein HYZ39_17335 [Mycolicibacterium cosmeticum]|nr:hypothetical protein [Mycolicibacterium cosmeticum]